MRTQRTHAVRISRVADRVARQIPLPRLLDAGAHVDDVAPVAPQPHSQRAGFAVRHATVVAKVRRRGGAHGRSRWAGRGRADHKRAARAACVVCLLARALDPALSPRALLLPRLTTIYDLGIAGAVRER
jgi:hypothetical protein